MADDYAGDTTTTGRLTNGVAATGVLEVATDDDWFRFTSVGGTYVITTSTTGFRIYNQSGVIQYSAFSTTPGIPQTISLTAGTYYVGVSGIPSNTSAPFSYTVSEYILQSPYFASSNVQMSVSRLTGLPAATPYAIAANSNTVRYSISGGAEAPAFVISPAANSGSGVGLFFTAPPTVGTYHVTVQASEAGAQPSYVNYTFNVFDDDFGDTAATGGQIVVGQTVRARFNAPQVDTDAFNTVLEANAVYAITLNGTSSAAYSLTFSDGGLTSSTLLAGEVHYEITSYRPTGSALITVRGPTVSDYSITLVLVEHIPQFTSYGGTASAPVLVRPGQIAERVTYTSDVGHPVTISLSSTYDAQFFTYDAATNTLRLNSNATANGDADHDGIYQAVLIVKGEIGQTLQYVYVRADYSDPTSPMPSTPQPASVQAGLSTEAFNLGRATASDISLSDPNSPLSKLIAAEQQIAAKLDAGTLSLADAQLAVYHLVDGTTSVAEISYAFFTGRTPTAQGLSYLVNSAANPSDLNDAYYQSFSTENRYINFAVNLATGAGAGASAFQAAYGSLSLADTTAKAYQAVFGVAPSADKVTAILNALVPNGLGGTETRAQYFVDITGGSAAAQKAAVIGFLLADSVKEGFGTYQQADLHFLQDLAHGTAVFNVDLIGVYSAPPTLVGSPVPG